MVECSYELCAKENCEGCKVNRKKLEAPPRKIDRIILGIVGKSGSGKSTLINRAVEEYPEMFNLVKSYSTRAVREDDPEDIKTHTFVTEEYWKENADKAIAVYFSPNGYVNWVDDTCFDPTKVNLYPIDPIALCTDLDEWCDVNDWSVYGIYIRLSDSARAKRYYARHGNTMKGWSIDNHLSEEILKDYDTVDYEVVDIEDMDRDEAFENFKYTLELLGGIRL